MSLKSQLQTSYLLYFSKPVKDRPIYQAMGPRLVRNIVELGVGRAERTLRMIELAATGVGVEEVRYTGIDPFESRTPADGPGLGLKEAYRLLNATGAKIRLIPGAPWSILPGVANTLANTDLFILSATCRRGASGDNWFYVPRMLRPQSLVFIENGRSAADGGNFRRVSFEQVTRRAGQVTRRSAA